MTIDFSNVLNNTTHVQVQAHWEPIANTAHHLHQPREEKFNRAKAQWTKPVDMTWKEALELFNPKPVHSLQHYNTTDFQVFLPSSTANVRDVWDLDPAGVLPFLRQFHPGASMKMQRYGSIPAQPNAKACLRALSPEYVDIVFRIHVSFTLDASIGAYFMPAQFAGHLVIDLNSGTICQFRLSLPPRNSNVAIGAFRNHDLAFVPRMELCSVPAPGPQATSWRKTITMEEARKKLASTFYKFTEIVWTTIDDAVELAKASNRRIHAVLLFGVLDDESC